MTQKQKDIAERILNEEANNYNNNSEISLQDASNYTLKAMESFHSELQEKESCEFMDWYRTQEGVENIVSSSLYKLFQEDPHRL